MWVREELLMALGTVMLRFQSLLHLLLSRFKAKDWHSRLTNETSFGYLGKGRFSTEAQM